MYRLVWLTTSNKASAATRLQSAIGFFQHLHYSCENHRYYFVGLHHTIIRRISVVGAWTLNFDFRENRLHDSVKTRPICYPQTSGVQYPLSLYGCIQLLQLNDFWVVLVSPLSIGYSPTAADGSALCCTIGGSLGRS